MEHAFYYGSCGHAYDDRVFPHLIDFACSTMPNRKLRDRIVPRAERQALEFGFGSGLNLPLYDRHKVHKIWGLERSEGRRRKARPAVDASDLDAVFYVHCIRPPIAGGRNRLGEVPIF